MKKIIKLGELQKKIKLVDASLLLADFWGVEPFELVRFVAITNTKKKKEWDKIIRDVISFRNMTFNEQAKAVGLKITKGL